MKKINCAICGALFEPITYNAKYCTDECRKEGKRLINHEWDKNNREYNRQRLREYRANQRAKKRQAQKENKARIKKAIERKAGGKTI